MSASALPYATSLLTLTILDELDSALNLMLVVTVWSAFLVPIAIALFFFSDSHMRRKPIFILNTLTITLGLGVGALNIYNLKGAITQHPVDARVTTALTCLFFLIPITVQAILLFRVVAVYPAYSLSWKLRLVIYGPFFAMMVARIVNASFCVARIAEGASAFGNTFNASEAVWDLPYAKVEWFLQLFYDTYASALFIIRMQAGRAPRARHGELDSVTRRYYPQRLQTLFWIAVSNFVFPVFLNIAQIVLIFRDRNFFDGTYVLVVNLYVEIIGVLLATVWCSGKHWQSAASDLLAPRTVAGHKREFQLNDGGTVSKVSNFEVPSSMSFDFHIHVSEGA